MVYDIKEYKYTIFTPTFNRKKLLPRAYESLLRQSFKDFIWLIVDDGSNDGTEQMVESWKRDNLLKIEYIYKENGGKYSAMVKAFHLISTKYCITLDSDDELTHDAISVFDKQWDLIESQGLENEVVEIRANSVYSDNGDIVGNFSLSDKQTYLDTTWHIFYFRMNATNECLSCHKTILLKNVFNPAELFWLSGKFKSIQESVFWSRYNKHGKLRYISRNLRIYHRDADNSILRHTISETGYFDELVSYKYFFSENMEFIHYAPKIYLNYIVKYFLCGFILKIGLQNLFSEARGLRFKIWLIVTLPISIAALMYFKFIRKKILAGYLSRTKNLLIRNAFNAFGWKTRHKIVVFESDDWGMIRMASKESFLDFKARGLPVQHCIYNSNDSIESNDDLELLFDVLKSVKNAHGEHAKFTANTVVANPNFDAIKKDDFSEYHYEPFPVTLLNYPNRDKVLSLYFNGIQENLFRPQFHGREHVNIARWMNDLQNNDLIAQLAFTNNMFSVASRRTKNYGSQYLDSLGSDFNDQIIDHSESILSGIKLFEEIFGFTPKSFIAPCYKYNSDLNKVLSLCGIKYIQGSRVQLEPIENLKESLKNISFYRSKNEFNQTYLVRNAYFEVAEDPHKDWVDSCMKEINSAFFWMTPAIISSHRVNYIGSIRSENRQNTLNKLSTLLKSIVKQWPDVIFLFSDELGNYINNTESNE